jgi:hypothetical protein
MLNMTYKYKTGDKVTSILSPDEHSKYYDFFKKYRVLTIRRMQLSRPPRYWFEENILEDNNYGRDEDQLRPLQPMNLEDFV